MYAPSLWVWGGSWGVPIVRLDDAVCRVVIVLPMIYAHLIRPNSPTVERMHPMLFLVLAYIYRPVLKRYRAVVK